MLDVTRARHETPGTRHCIHLNNCGAALMPTPVIDAVSGHIALEGRIGGYEAAARAHEAIEHTYDAIARLLGACRDEIAIVENATRGWGMVFYALQFGPGDRILTSTVEYASNYIAHLQIARRTGAVIDIIPQDSTGVLDIAALEHMIDDRVKLIAVTHVPTHCGLVNPARAIGRLARAHGIPYLLDACQSVGQMQIDVNDLNVDFLSATSRKFLRGPRGVGFVYVRRPWIERLEPPLLDVHAATWTSRDTYTVRPDARRFENWESFVAGRIGLGVAIDYALEWGIPEIANRIMILAERMRAGLAAIPGVVVHDRAPGSCGIVGFSVNGCAADVIVAGLCAETIHTSISRAPSTLLDMSARGLCAVVRAGVHYYNTENEIDRCCRTVARMAGHSPRSA